MSLWNYTQLTKKICFPHKRMRKIPNPIQRASFCICHKASYTVEAAIVIPLISMYLVMLLFFFPILKIQCVVDEALMYAGRKTAVECSVLESEEILAISAETYMLYVLKDNSLVDKYIKHGMWGIQLWNSSFEGEDIILRAEYVVKLPFSFGGLGEIRLSSQNSFRKWSKSIHEEAPGGYVYVTETGEVYHKNIYCRSIHLSVKSCVVEEISSLRGKNGQRYYECDRCEWISEKKERVYYTDYGTLYHKDIACSAIKRMVEKIKIEEIEGTRPCNFCCES